MVGLKVSLRRGSIPHGITNFKNIVMNIQELESNKLLAYKYVRGSTLYNTNIETSDVDYGGVFILPNDKLLGLPCFYQEQASDEKHDTTYYEFNRWVELLIKANPNALESLYVPKDKVVGEIHPAIQLIIDNRDLFLTKECFKSLSGYAYAQIQKCRGLNKKCVQPVMEKKDVLDFCYTFKEQGSQPIKEFLAERGLDQKYCGLVSIPNMKDVYGVYYDFASFIHFEQPENWEKFFYKFGSLGQWDKIQHRITCRTFFGYSGIVHPDGKSNEVRLSSIPKGEMPICFMTYNQNGYESYCRKYKEYQEWVEKRNPARYESNLKSNYDVKNVAHCVRLLHMGKELAEGKGFNVVRTWDREMILDIRNHKYEYEEIIEYVEKVFTEMKELAEKCNLPKTVDLNKINDLILQARKML
jgi:predicted nucleotidyltransferase